MATDPICGMTVNPESAAGNYLHNGQSYYFCSQHCLAKFKEEPGKVPEIGRSRTERARSRAFTRARDLALAH